jgi:hypothetical protein
MLRTSTKTKLGAKAVKQVAGKPGLLRIVPPAAGFGWKVAKPLAKRRARKRAEHVGEAVRAAAVTVSTYTPKVVRTVESLTAPPKRRPVSPALVGVPLGAGVLVGGAAVYLLEPQVGREHRRQLRRLVK